MRARQEVRLEDRLEHDLRRCLHDPIAHRRDAQRPLLAAFLLDVPPPHRLRSVPLRSQLGLDLCQQSSRAVALDVGEGLGIDPRRAAVRSHSLPRRPQDVIPVDAVVQSVEASTRGPLRRGPQPALEVAHFGIGRSSDGVVGPVLLTGHALVRGSASDVVTVRALPYPGVLLRRDPRYYDPPGLPLHSGRFRLRLMRRALPRLGPCRRVSPVPHPSLRACHRPYPGETRRALRISRAGRGLRRDMSGSALPLFICRGCNVHWWLRPARSLPPWRLSTPRLGRADLSARLGPATRPSDAYRGGTSTRWRGAAGRDPFLEW